MQLYISGSLGKSQFRQIEQLLRYDGYRLCTYAYPKEIYVYLDIAEELNIRAKVMIDSGAFTAWAGGKPVQLKKLITYSKALIERYGGKHDFVFISLDVMPGEKGRNPTEAELKSSMRISYDNYLVYKKEMEPYEVVPVFHSGEPIQLRDWYLKHTNHIALSMNQAMGEKHRIDWATRVQVPGVKMHGLAATGTRMVRYVDWFSVDSAAWIMIAAMGNIYWPLADGGIGVVSVSAKSPKIKSKDSHLTNMPMFSSLLSLLEKKGYTLDALMHDYSARMSWNLDVWMTHNWVRTPLFQRGLFDD